MSPFIHWWLPLLALLAAPAAVAAGDAVTDARAALALAVAARRPTPPARASTPGPADEYERLRARAVVEGRVLLVWVGLDRPDLEIARPDCLHYRCGAFPGAEPPCVVVGRPAGGELWRDADLPAAAADTLAPHPPPAAAAFGSACGPGGCRHR